MTAPVFKICFDESGSAKRGDFYALAGVVAKKQQWRQFYPAWRSALRTAPSIAYFKMHEAHSLTGEFSRQRGWNKPLVREKVELLTSVVRNHASRHIVALVPMTPFRRIMRTSPLDIEYENPYLMSFLLALMGVSQHMNGLGGSRSKPILVFDRQEKAVMQLCNRINAHFRDARPEEKLQHEVGRWLSEITWGDDRNGEPGIQAADLIAWHYRTLPWERFWKPHRRRRFLSQVRDFELIAPDVNRRNIESWKWDLLRHVEGLDAAKAAERAGKVSL